MDKQLLEALDNLSVALELLSNSLNNNDGTSGVATALQFGNFSDQLIEINKSIKEIKVSNKKILDNTETLIKLQKQKNDNGIFSGISQDGNKKMLKDGITTITLIAGAVLAIGLAFKLLGGVDWKSVLSLSIALPLIAYSFEKISQIKGLTISSILTTSAALIAISFAILISSKILSGVAPVGLFQLTTVVFIAAAFGAAAFGIGKLLKSLESISITTALKGSILMPIVLIAMSYAIAKSSSILRTVQPIGLFQALTIVMISVAFGAAAFGIGKLLSSFKGISITSALTAAALIPVVLVAMSYAIAKSSKILSEVIPIGIFQALTAIMIAGTFVVLSYAVKPLMKGVEGVSLKQAILGTLILLALSASVVAVAWLMLKMPIVPFSTILNFAITGVAISTVVVILALAIRAVNSLGTVKDYLSGGLSIVIISSSISISSIILSKGNYTNPPSIIWTLLSTASIFAYSLLGWFIGKIGGVTDYIKGGLSIIVVASTIMVTSHILSLGNYKKYPNIMWGIGTVMSIGLFAVGAALLGVFLLQPNFYMGLGVILIVAASIVGVSKIFELGQFKKYPSINWVLPTISLLGGFAVISALMGIGSPLILLGLAVTLAVSGTILLIDKIFEKGKFVKYPNVPWIRGVDSTLTRFVNLIQNIRKSIGIVGLGIGALKLLGLTEVILKIDKLMSDGKFKIYPSKEWIQGVSFSFTEFSKMMDDSSFLTIIKQKISSFFGGGLDDMAYGIVKLDSIFSKGTFAKFPSKPWIDGIQYTLTRFKNIVGDKSWSSIIKSIFSGDSTSVLSKMTKSISDISISFSTGDFSKYPKAEWVNGTIYALEKFGTILKMLKFDWVGDKISTLFGSKSPLEEAVSNIVLLATAFDKLGTSMNKFSNSIQGIDLESLKMVKGLTNNVILLSLMDPDMLNDVLDKIEKRGGVFTELIKDFEDKKSSLSSTSVKTVSISPKSKSDYEMLSDKVDKMIILLSDIQSVVGSGGALKNYLISIKDPQLAGNNNSPTSVRR
jgi:hypothetical protein